MARSRGLRIGDLRAIYLLVGECREVGADPVAWQSHLLKGLMRTLGATIGVAIEADETGYPGPCEEPLRPSCIVDVGWESESTRECFHRLVRDEPPTRNPLLPPILAQSGAVRTFHRRDLLTDDDYYGNE